MNHPNIPFTTLVAAAVLAARAASASAPIYINCGPYAPENWNACNFLNSRHRPTWYPGTDASASLVDHDGNPSGVRLFVAHPAVTNISHASATFLGNAAEFEEGRAFPGYSSSTGTTVTRYTTSACCVAADIDEALLDDPSQGHFHEGCLKGMFTGLDPARTYAFTFLAVQSSRTGDMGTRYTVVGANQGSATLNAASNRSNVARIPGIAPLPDGSVEFSAEPTESNDTPLRFGYLNMIKIEESDALGAEDIYIDPTGTPDQSARKWNACSLTSAGTVVLTNSLGSATGVQLVTTLMSSGCGKNTAATTELTGDAAAFNDARTSNDQLFVTKGNTIRASLTGLARACTYDFAFVASRTDANVTNVYTTRYTVTGDNEGTAVLDARNNASEVATVAGIRPAEDGSATFSISAAEDATVSYGYVLAIRVSRRALSGDGTLPVAALATEGGDVSATVAGEPSAPSRYLAPDQTLVATATPQPKYRFRCWTSSWTNAPVETATIAIPGSQAATWTAVFERADEYATKTLYVDAYGTPAASADAWNALGDFVYARGAALTNLVTSDGRRSPVAFTAVLPCPEYRNPGVRHSTDYADFATQEGAPFAPSRGDSGDQALLALSTVVSGTNTGGSALAFDVSGLVPGHPYTFRFAGIHNSTTAYGSRFRCSGLNSVQAYGLGSSAGPEIAVVPAVLPSADGTIRVEMSIGPNTADFGNGRQFLGAFSIEGDLAVSTPSATVVLFH